MNLTEPSLLTDIDKMFTITLTDIDKIIAAFHAEMKQGLDGQESSLKMLPAFTQLPTGNEKGHFIALDLGGTHFRVLHVNLLGDGKSQVEHSNKYVLPKPVIQGTGVELFNFIANSIKDSFIQNNIDFNEKRDLGFTFSFPVEQIDIANGILITWTKAFTASGVEGKNVVTLLEDALKHCGVNNIRVAALANDTVGTIVAKSYQDLNCSMGIIFGTGTNACYNEKMINISKLKGFQSENMVVNMEWGNFNKLPITPYDKLLDKGTLNQGKQRLEKMISGMYLGEMVRLILSDLIEQKIIFANCKGKLIKNDFGTKYMTLVELDTTENLDEINEYLSTVGLHHATFDDRKLLKRVCTIVSNRAATLSSVAISAVISWMDPQLQKNHTIAIDGSLYEKYPHFKNTILHTLGLIYKDNSEKIKLSLAKDGSGIGVAIVASVAASANDRSAHE